MTHKLFEFQFEIGGEPVGDPGVISIDQAILDVGLSKEFKDIFYDLKDEAGVAAHLAWTMFVNNYRYQEHNIEGWNIQPGQVLIMKFPQGWNDYGCTAEAM